MVQSTPDELDASVPAEPSGPTTIAGLTHRIVAAIAACYRAMDPLVAQVIATPGVVPVKQDEG